MLPMTRSRIARCVGALVGVAALGAALPAPALAKDRHHDHRRHRHDRHCDHDRGHRHDRHYDHDRGHRNAWKHDRHDRGRHHAYYAPRFLPAPPHWDGEHRHHTPAYYCGRCRTHFGSYDGLYEHVHHDHRVPTWYVPGVLAQVSFGWTFGF